MPPKSERRFAIDGWQSVDFKVRAIEDGDGMTFEGYAAVFDTDSDGPIPGFGIEQIAPGAFKRSLNTTGRDIRMFLNHNDDLLLASRDAGTLELAEDDIGLLSRAHFIDTTVGLDTAKNVRAKNITKMSFGFAPVESEARKDGVKGTRHTEVALWEVSPISSWPAYGATSATVRHLAFIATTNPDEFDAQAELLVAELDEAQRDSLRDYLNRQSATPLMDPNLVAITSRVGARRSELAELQRLIDGLA